ncbi:Calcium-responsive transactivator [Anabarilius grahami]|uniref:Calcium-responsive transactivator n=1 Tax=Anabarilius grahami TaxID=495550 RepID=A0A3N0Z437_ANAGA|nr:Calcium-responsive transactivator [Anabarilius grahami]
MARRTDELRHRFNMSNRRKKADEDQLQPAVRNTLRKLSRATNKNCPTDDLWLGPGGMSQGGGGQSLHSQTNMNDSMGTGLPPTSLMQSQMNNGPSHAPMQQQPTISMSLPPSSHGTGPGYSHSVPSSQGAPLQGQVAYSSMASRANLNMQSSQVSVMHQHGTGPHYSSTSAGGQHYQSQQTVGMMGQGNQGSSMMPQRPMGSYRAPQQGRCCDLYFIYQKLLRIFCVCM